MKIKLITLTICLALTACSKDQPKNEKSHMDIIDKFDHDAYSIRDENHPDAKIIAQLIQAGADLKKLHKPDFKFDFKEVEDARNVAKNLLEKGFTSKIYAPQEGFPTYEIVAEKEMIIEFTTMADLSDSLGKLAKDNNGTLSGWGTSVEK